MSEKVYLKLNTSLSTCSNANTLERNANGDARANIELRLPDNLTSTPCSSVDVQLSKLRLSLSNIPHLFIPVDPTLVKVAVDNNQNCIPTKAHMALWPFYINDRGDIVKRESRYPIEPGVLKRLEIARCLEKLDTDFAIRTGMLPIRSIDTFLRSLQSLLNDCFMENVRHSYIIDEYPDEDVRINFRFVSEISLGTDFFKIKYSLWQIHNPVSGTYVRFTPVLLGAPGAKPFTDANTNNTIPGSMGYQNSVVYVGTEGNPGETNTLGYNILVDEYMMNILHFLPWLEKKTWRQLASAQAQPWYEEFNVLNERDNFNTYVLDLESAVTTTERATGIWHTQNPSDLYSVVSNYGTTFSHTFNNLATVNISPIASIAVLVDGMGATPQIMPVNIKQLQGSSLTTTIPVLENYIPITQNLRDLHDDLVIAREAYENTPLIKLHPSALFSRTLAFRAVYITKDGQMFDIYISPTGVFSLQLTFCLRK